jgi:hypothetical protein
MARSEISSRICGFTTAVEARTQDLDRVSLTIASESQAIQELSAELTKVSSLQEVSFRGSGPLTHRLAACRRWHAACPAPVGIIKAVDVAAGLALPADVTIKASVQGKAP